MDEKVLIETYWNVKFFSRFLRFLLSARINRNILECKEYSPFYVYMRQIGINRNILECKVVKNWGAISEWFVLIETYWNVKADRTGLSPAFWRY